MRLFVWSSQRTPVPDAPAAVPEEEARAAALKDLELLSLVVLGDATPVATEPSAPPAVPQKETPA